MVEVRFYKLLFDSLIHNKNVKEYLDDIFNELIV